MNYYLLDLVWPAIYISQTIYQFWFLIIGTVIIEAFVVRHFLKYTWKKSWLVSLLGNFTSGFLGSYLMARAMMIWELLIQLDTFGNANWIVSYILMCLGSVFIETVAVKLFFLEKIKRLFLPMMVGNVLSYLFIALVIMSPFEKKPDTNKSEVFKYLPEKKRFVLMDGSALLIDTLTIAKSNEKSFNKLSGAKQTRFKLQIPFSYGNKNQPFGLMVLGSTEMGGIESKKDSQWIQNFTVPELKENYTIFLFQNNPNDPDLGWEKLITDTILFKQINRSGQ